MDRATPFNFGRELEILFDVLHDIEIRAVREKLESFQPNPAAGNLYGDAVKLLKKLEEAQASVRSFALGIERAQRVMAQAPKN